jgi:hypothetical protein
MAPAVASDLLVAMILDLNARLAAWNVFIRGLTDDLQACSFEQKPDGYKIFKNKVIVFLNEKKRR